MTEEEICGVSTGDGTPCQNPAGDNGFCHIPSHNPGDDNENPAGRDTKLSHELQERIAASLEAGVPVKHAAPMHGISEQTFYDWMKRGEDEENTIFSDFSERVSRAREQGKGSLISDAVKAAKKKEDAHALLKIYETITDGEAAHDDEGGIPFVVPESARPDKEELEH